MFMQVLRIRYAAFESSDIPLSPGAFIQYKRDLLFKQFLGYAAISLDFVMSLLFVLLRCSFSNFVQN